jgi:arylsulfatase A-like enzyme
MVRLTIAARRAAAALVLASGPILFAADASAAPPERPNVIFVLADDLGWAELGSYGQQKIRTPALDRLAAEGMRFTQHYAGNAVCAPSRAVLLTGRHPGHNPIRDNRELQPEGQWPLPAPELTLLEVFRGRGYATAAMGKWGLGPPGSEGAGAVKAGLEARIAEWRHGIGIE